MAFGRPGKRAAFVYLEVMLGGLAVIVCVEPVWARIVGVVALFYSLFCLLITGAFFELLPAITATAVQRSGRDQVVALELFEISLIGRALGPALWAMKSHHVETAGHSPEVNAWQLTTPDGSEWLHLRGPAAEHAYGEPDKAVRLQLYARPSDVPGQLSPQVEVAPAPTRGTLVVVIQFTFANASGRWSESRTLTVAEPLVPDLALEQVTSALGEPLPREAFGAGGELTVTLRAILPPDSSHG